MRHLFVVGYSFPQEFALEFPTDTIRKHLDFYWRTTLEILKRFVEGRPASQI